MTDITRRGLMAGAASIALLSACKPPDTTLSYAGATTQLPSITEAARLFEARHPGTRIEIGGGGSSIGIRSVVTGKADLGGAARDLSPAEAAQVISLPWARDGIAVVAGPDVPFNGIDRDGLRALFSAAQVPDGVTRIAKSWAHGTAQAFANGVGLEQAEIHSEAVAGSNGEVLAMLAAVADGLGYVSVSDATAAIDSGAPLRILPVDGVMPSPRTLADGSYPLARTLWLLLPPPEPGRAQPKAGAFVAFLKGPETAQILRRRGFLPID